jgi:hypothetical protein
MRPVRDRVTAAQRELQQLSNWGCMSGGEIKERMRLNAELFSIGNLNIVALRMHVYTFPCTQSPTIADSTVMQQHLSRSSCYVRPSLSIHTLAIIYPLRKQEASKAVQNGKGARDRQY